MDNILLVLMDTHDAVEDLAVWFWANYFTLIFLIEGTIGGMVLCGIKRYASQGILVILASVHSVPGVSPPVHCEPRNPLPTFAVENNRIWNVSVLRFYEII